MHVAVLLSSCATRPAFVPTGSEITSLYIAIQKFCIPQATYSDQQPVPPGYYGSALSDPVTSPMPPGHEDGGTITPDVASPGGS
jgi:hypothetical protein